MNPIPEWRAFKIAPVSVLVTCLFCVVCRPAWAIVTSDGPGTHVVREMDDTFGLNLGGVALFGSVYPTGPKGGCSGVLITDRHILTAAHCFDHNGDLEIDPEIFLWPTEVVFDVQGDWIEMDYDPAKVIWSEKWETTRSDIAIATLEEDVPPEVPRYALYGGNAEVGQPYVLAGSGMAGSGALGADASVDGGSSKMRAGLNRYDRMAVVENAQFLVADFDSGQPEHNSLGDLGFGVDEVMTANLDSGSPGFLNGAVASIVAFSESLPLVDATEWPDSSWGERDYGTRVSSFRDFIVSVTDGEAVFVVPTEQSKHGDFDSDQRLTVDDIDLLSRAIRFGITHGSFDLNNDNEVDQSDRNLWVKDVFGTAFGDANLDGKVTIDDFHRLASAFNAEGGWGEGDFDGSGLIQFADFLVLSAHYSESAMPALSTQVPEPSAFLLALIVATALLPIRRTRRDAIMCRGHLGRTLG